MRLKALFPGCLALGIVIASVTGSACFTLGAMDSARPTTEARSPTLRVRHCYLTAKNQLLVLAEGGAWRPDAGATPMDKISLGLELNQLATQPGAGVTALPQSILHAGWPDADFLQRNGYAEVVFAEHFPVRGPADPDQRSREEVARVVVRYESTFPSTSPTDDYLGLRPAFTVQNVPGLRRLSFSVADTVKSSHLGSLLLVPLTIPLDIVTSPLQLLFLLTYRGG